MITKVHTAPISNVRYCEKRLSQLGHCDATQGRFRHLVFNLAKEIRWKQMSFHRSAILLLSRAMIYRSRLASQQIHFRLLGCRSRRNCTNPRIEQCENLLYKIRLLLSLIIFS